MDKKPYYLTTAIAYASGRPHIGNSYEIIFSDALARFKRSQGYDVFFQTGTDEHGIKIEEKAEQAGTTPKEFVDAAAADIRSNWDLLNTSYDHFIRTTDPDHEKTVQKIFKKLYEQGDIYKGEYEGWYCTPCESFWTETQLEDGMCPDCHRPVQKAREEAYFFNMKKYADRLLEYIETHPEFILPESRKNEMVNNFLKPGLQDLCVSRTTFDWGIPVDFDPEHVVYVWLDALSNYITSLGYDPYAEEQDERFQKYWPADHVIGKDILRFHTIYWPIFLMALGVELPKHVFGHPWLLVSQGKMSKSRGNVIYAEDLAKYFPVDAIRYFCLHEMPYANDGTISWDLMVERNNSDLANNLGNLYSRVVSMANKYFDGNVDNPGIEEDVDRSLKKFAENTVRTVEAEMDEFKVAAALDAIFKLYHRANKYIDETMPWVLAKDEDKKERLQTVLYNLLESIRIGAVLMESFLPETSEKILDGLKTEQRSLDSVREFGGLEKNHKIIEKTAPLFARMDEKKFFEQLEKDGLWKPPVVEKETPKKEKKQKKAKKQAEPAEISDFEKIELKVGKVLEARKHPQAERLLIESIDLGNGDIRQVVSGIAEKYEPADLIGRNVIVVSNLKPAKLRGEVSEGMILCSEPDGKVLFVDESIEPGSKVR